MTIDDKETVLTKCIDEKDLGVTFDDQLTFDRHINNAVAKANRMLGLIKRSFCYMDMDIFVNLYKTLLQPHLEYGNVIWHPLYKRQSSAVERVQRRATKLVGCIKNVSYQERLQN